LGHIILFKRADPNNISKEQRGSYLAKQAAFRKNWYISGAVNAPWTKIRLENLISRLRNIIIDRACACMGKSGAVTPAMRSLQSFYRQYHGGKSGLRFEKRPYGWVGYR
jgi:hypothetical protein